ncbi:hypothetical protein BRD05_01670 [Halobacteriales archaeon QS_9_70_65]|nr:MAG: hypothetical protein BRD05_01670 [Halobacteriales archaeon QS_9_70_65]
MSDGLTHAAWSDALREGVLLGGACDDCGTTAGTPKAACPHCGARGLEPVELPTAGTVYTETTVEVPPEGIDERGYRVAVVDLGVARVLGRLDGAAEIGDAVALAGHVEDEQGYVVPRFEPA